MCKTLSSGMYGAGKWVDIILCHPTHSQGYATKAESGPHQVHTIGDISIPCISNISTHPLAENLIQYTGSVLVSNS